MIILVDRDYIITFDENGQPYIAHMSWRGIRSMASGRVSKGAGSTAQGVGRGVRKVHKYLLKVGEGARAQYAYTKEEVDRLMGRGRQKVSDAVSSVKQKASSAIKSGRDKLTSTSAKVRDAVSDFSSRSASTIKRHGSELLSEVVKARDSVGTKVRDKAKDLVGYDEYERYEKAWDRTSEAKDRLEKNPNSAYAQREVDKAEQEEAKAHEEYLKSPLGRARSAKETVKSTADAALEKAKEIAQNTVEKAKEAGTKAADKAKDLVGYDEKERVEVAQKEFQDKYEEGLRLTEEREPIRKAYYDYDTEMFQKYGVNYEDKMTPSEKAKYDKLGKELSDISEKWWDATITQMHSAAYRSDPTLRDKLDDAIAEYQNTPLGMLDKLRHK